MTVRSTAFRAVVAGALALILNGASVAAQQLGTADDAKAMLDRAFAALRSNHATALGELNDPKNKQFHDRDLYVFCFEI
jgi:cytochrome c